jgi:hypothetical protein
MRPLVLSACCLISGAAWLLIIHIIRRFPVTSLIVFIVVFAFLWFWFVSEDE